ncbi:MAG: hypothetical protein KDD37_04940 [Bdellovibrionales bacterium]|nr:hypothetical protein [Bdellovibrionales bacterium]
MEKAKTSRKAKASGNTEQTGAEQLPSSFKKFRQLPEMEAFYRFIYENDLRKEGKAIIDRLLMSRKAEKLAARSSKKKSAKVVN